VPVAHALKPAAHALAQWFMLSCPWLGPRHVASRGVEKGQPQTDHWLRGTAARGAEAFAQHACAQRACAARAGHAGMSTAECPGGGCVGTRCGQQGRIGRAAWCSG